MSNAIGRRTSMTDASGSTSWLYDARGRVTKETKVISSSSFVTEWTYNSADLPVTLTYPDDEVVTTVYNSRMLPISVTGADPYVSSMTYDSAARLLTRALGNGLTQTYTYYPWDQQGGRLQTLAAGSLQNLTYAYDPVGNILSIADTVSSETQTYTYDALDRLTSWTLNGSLQESYAYDPASGNLTSKGALTLTYGDANHAHAVTSVSNQSTVNSYQYDQNGNQTTRTIGQDTFNLLYDAENRLVEVKKNGATIAQFVYDGDGKRVKSVINGETTLFVGNYYEQKGSQATKYYFAGTTRIAMRKYVIPQNMTVEYLFGDHLGSTSITTDSNGALISEIRYKPWGEVRYTWTDTPANTSPAYELVKYQYTGQYSYDVEFGLLFYNARWYDPYLNRFTQPDSIVPLASQGTQAWDRYAYANNNPVRYNDPTGHIACESFDDYGNCIEDPFWNWHNNNGLQVSAEGLDFIKKHEGSVKDGDLHILYDDPAGNCTIGYGHLVHLEKCDGMDPSEAEFLNGIDEDAATQWLSTDVESASDAVRHNTEVPLTQEEFDALVSFTYNVGAANFTRSDLLVELNQGNYNAVRDELNRWIYGYDASTGSLVKLPGLVTRRYEEGLIFWYWFYP